MSRRQHPNLHARSPCSPRLAVLLWQGNAQSLPLFLDTSGGTALNAQDLQTEMGAGVRVGVVRVGVVRAINER